MKKTCKKENGNMNFIVEENAIYYMDENREKNAEVTFPKLDEHTVEINHILCFSLLSGEPVWQGN